MDIIQTLTDEFQIRREQVENVVALLDDGKTVPFIARYRKEMHGALDDQTIRRLALRLQALRNLEERKEEVRTAIENKNAMTEEIAKALAAAKTLVEVEDIYRPYKEKRSTRGSKARERGLTPLAELILAQDPATDPEEAAQPYISEEKEVPDTAAALQGAMDIIAEQIADDAKIRTKMRDLYQRFGTLVCTATDPEAESVYRNYYEFESLVPRVQGHQVLAIHRGEKEEYLKVTINVAEGLAEQTCTRPYVKNDSACGELVRQAACDAAKRLIIPSIIREVRSAQYDAACTSAIRVFASNLEQLLMQPPLRNTVTLGLDPAYRTGCKLAVVDGTGKVLDTGVIYPTPPHKKIEEAGRKVTQLVSRYGITAVSIGNGTASRESESFIADLLPSLPHKVSYMVVSEAGASVYSASELAAAEFPEYDVALRSAVSIARRLQDPLAELVKIDPKAIGVGQYQHDMPKNELQTALDGVVEECVNAVGVDVNTASAPLLSHIAGISAAVAKNIVTYREENGPFDNRKQLLKVPKLGPKAFEQCAGFLRIPGGSQPLDNTAVHPESYDAAKSLLARFGYSMEDAAAGKLSGLADSIKKAGKNNLAQELGIGTYTLDDMAAELQKPGRDPRDLLPPPLLRSGSVMELSDLKPGMELMGTVRNIVDFGCFVDIGVHEDGLVHISQICDHYIKHPLEAVKVGDVVKVWVLDVDVKRGRISLTMLGEKPKKQQRNRK
ncbi:MAG: RNA-binding transcriptional accessory protein [Oscillospiraceae bacterium]|nr:RNA-binding transcriptional accessory protein [Oscillospiraceae bacterium]